MAIRETLRQASTYLDGAHTTHAALATQTWESVEAIEALPEAEQSVESTLAAMKLTLEHGGHNVVAFAAQAGHVVLAPFVQ